MKKECVLAERVAEYYNTGHTGYAAQAIQMIEAFRGEIEGDLLDRELGSGAMKRTFEALERLASEDVEITDTLLRDVRRELRSGPSND